VAEELAHHISVALMIILIANTALMQRDGVWRFYNAVLEHIPGFQQQVINKHAMQQ